jgi:hypothetical protein
VVLAGPVEVRPERLRKTGCGRIEFFDRVTSVVKFGHSQGTGSGDRSGSKTNRLTRIDQMRPQERLLALVMNWHFRTIAEIRLADPPAPKQA